MSKLNNVYLVEIYSKVERDYDYDATTTSLVPVRRHWFESSPGAVAYIVGESERTDGDFYAKIRMLERGNE